jgi:DNA primase
LARITSDSVERVRQAASIVDVVSAYTDLRQRGGRHVGLCPFHDERTPSFGVDPAKNVYYCFGCQAGGDVFRFLQEKEGLDFPQAVEELADRFGVELAYERSDPGEEERRRAGERLYEVLAKTAGFYVRYLWDSAEAARARDYLEQRGLGREVLERFGVGFAPSAWDRVLTSALSAGYKEQELHAAGLAQEGKRGGYYDRFRARIMFPIRDARRRVLGFGARAVREGQMPKYVNSPENTVYHKSKCLFGIDLARPHATRSGEIIVVEGYTDVLALHQAGFENAVAAMGTALTDDQVAELSRAAGTVILAFDADSSGQEATLRVQRAAQGRGVDLKVVRLPDDKDPSDLLQEEGAGPFRDRLGKATSFLEFQVSTVVDRADVSSPAGKDRAIAELAPVFGGVEMSAERDEQLRRVADRLGLSEHLLAPLLAQPARAVRAPVVSGPSVKHERPERVFLAMCIASGDRGREYLGRLDDEHLSSTVLREARDWLMANFDASPMMLPRNDDELGQTVSEIVIRSTGEPADEFALESAFLGLERRRLDREIKKASEEGDFDRHRELTIMRAETIARGRSGELSSGSPDDGRQA